MSEATMSYYLERIQRGVDFIEPRLDEDLPLASVAKVAGLSLWHFQRIFRALTGDTLKAYIRSRRLAASLDRLLESELRVLDIALLAGFDSQEAYARAFKSAFELTPQEYRRLGKKTRVLKKPPLDAALLAHLQQNVTLTPQLAREPRRQLVGMRTLFFGIESEKNNFSEKLPALWAAFLPRLPHIPARVPGVAYGVIREERGEDEQLEYHAAAEVTAVDAAFDLPSLEIPPATYATFTHRGPAQELDRTVSYIYGSWLPRSEHRHGQGADLEIYGPEYHPTSDGSLIYYAIPVAD